MASVTPATLHRLQALRNQVLDWEIVEREQAEMVKAAQADLAYTREQLALSAKHLHEYLVELGAVETLP